MAVTWGRVTTDLHLQAFEAMGLKMTMDSNYLEPIHIGGPAAERRIYMDTVDVGATINTLCYCNRQSRTIIENAAQGPEIVMWQLSRIIWERIRGAGTDIIITIEGSTPSWNASSSNSRPYRGETYIALAAAIGQKFRLIMSFMSIWKAQA